LTRERLTEPKARKGARGSNGMVEALTSSGGGIIRDKGTVGVPG